MKLKKPLTVLATSVSIGAASMAARGVLASPLVAQASNTTAYTVTANVLNIRAGAGTNYRVTGTLTRGQTIAVQSIANGWARITHNGNTAFVSAEWISRANNNSGTTQVTNYTVTANVLNVRASAGTNHEIIGTLNRGQTIGVESIVNGWARITHHGRTAFVSAEWISRVGTNHNTPVQTTTYTVTANVLNIRAGAGTTFGIVGTFNRGQTIAVESTSGGWARITHNGRTAFVSAEWISRAGANNNTSSQTTTYTVTANILNIRAGAGTTFGIVGTFNRGQTIAVESISGGWARITHNGRAAFVSAEWIARANTNHNTSVTTTPYTVTTNILNIRAGAGTTYSIVGTFNRGQTINVQSISGGWARITHNGRTAFVSAQWIARADTVQTPQTPSDPQTPPPSGLPTPVQPSEFPTPTPPEAVIGIAPILTVPSQTTIMSGDPWDITSGVSAVDAEGRDITHLVVFTWGAPGWVCTLEPGTYTIHYAVTDANGNTVIATQTLIVTPWVGTPL